MQEEYLYRRPEETIQTGDQFTTGERTSPYWSTAEKLIGKLVGKVLHVRYKNPAYVNTEDPYIIREKGEIIQKGDEVTINPKLSNFDLTVKDQTHSPSDSWVLAHGWIGKPVKEPDSTGVSIRARYKNPNFMKATPLPPTKTNTEANVEIYL